MIYETYEAFIPDSLLTLLIPSREALPQEDPMPGPFETESDDSVVCTL